MELWLQLAAAICSVIGADAIRAAAPATSATAKARIPSGLADHSRYEEDEAHRAYAAIGRCCMMHVGVPCSKAA